jgi:hypothetical protein
MADWHPNSTQLAGFRVIVLAQTPRAGEHSALTSPVLEAEEAMADVVRAVVANGGQVTVFGDQALAMIALVAAGEYTTARLQEKEQEPPVFAYISAGTDGMDVAFVPFPTFGIGGFESMKEPLTLLADRAGNADAMVIIGSGTPDSIRTFRQSARSNAPVFAIAATGGLAAAIATGDTQDAKFVRVLDREIEENDEWSLKDDDQEPMLPPVALAAQRLIDELLRSRDRAVKR